MSRGPTGKIAKRAEQFYLLGEKRKRERKKVRIKKRGKRREGEEKRKGWKQD